MRVSPTLGPSARTNVGGKMSRREGRAEHSCGGRPVRAISLLGSSHTPFESEGVQKWSIIPQNVHATDSGPNIGMSKDT